MGFASSSIPNDDWRVDSMGSLNPLTPEEGLSVVRPTYLNPVTNNYEETPWTGLGTALSQGVGGGLAALGRTVNAASELNVPGNPLASAGQALEAFGLHQPIDESLARVQDWAKINPYKTGRYAETAGSVAHGVTVMGLGSLMGGPVTAAATLASTEGYNDYRDSVAAGIDPTTAAEKAGLTAVISGAGAFLPFKFGGAGASGLAASLVGGAAINTGFGVANRVLTSELLKSAGYPEMAAQYHDLDGQAMAADAVLGLAFGGFAHITHGANVPAAERPDPSMVQDALDARRNDMVARGAAGIPTDPLRANLDAKLQDGALGDMLSGRPTDIAPDDAASLAQGSIADPERAALTEAYERAGAVVHGDLADFSEPPRLTEAMEPPRLTDVVEPAAAAAPGASDDAALSPAARASLEQLTSRHPDLEVQAPDGRTVKASDLSDALQEDRAQSATQGRMIDAAIGCFMRTFA